MLRDMSCSRLIFLLNMFMFMIIFEVFFLATEIIAVKVIKKRTEWRNLRQS